MQLILRCVDACKFVLGSVNTVKEAWPTVTTVCYVCGVLFGVACRSYLSEFAVNRLKKITKAYEDSNDSYEIRTWHV
jgi:hypothetical protein